jgi:hypothetical protein
MSNEIRVIRLKIDTYKKLVKMKGKLIQKYQKGVNFDFVVNYLLELAEKKQENNNSATFSEEVLEELDILCESLGKDRNEVVKLLLRAVKPEMLTSVEEG